MINASDITIGMVLVNEGPSGIPVYNSKDATGDPEMTVAPKAKIGQVVDVVAGADYIFYFTSDEITASASVFDKVGSWILGLIPGKPVVNAGAVKFAEIANNISQSQIDSQNAIISNAANNGVSVSNSIKAAAKGAGEFATSAVSGLAQGFWPLILVAAGIYVVTRTNYSKSSGLTFK
jgi:hypothetical protein